MNAFAPKILRAPDEISSADGPAVANKEPDATSDEPSQMVQAAPAARQEPKDDTATRGLLEKNRKLLDEAKRAKEQLSAILEELGGEEGLEEIRDFRKRASESEEITLVKEGKIDALRERWLKQAKRDYERKISGLQQTLSEREQALTATKSRLQREIIGNAVRSAASRIKGFAETAADDAVLVAMQIFSLDDDGNIVGKDEAGVKLYSKDGNDKLMTPMEWLEMQQDVRPHWFYVDGGTGMRAAASSGRTITYSRVQARKDPLAYVKARREAEKAGKEVILIE